MRIESKLCHLTEKKAIVLVNGWINDKSVGSALGEGSTVEVAEDKAILRLNQRLNIKNINEDIKCENVGFEANIKIKEKKQIIEDGQKIINKIEEPNDWSSELASIDSEVKRLNWSREDEIRFLKRKFGYNSRNKITKYEEIINYLTTLKEIEESNPSIQNKVDINELINESELILKELSWDHKKGREYLQKEFHVSTRKELNEDQLKAFVKKLKYIRNKNVSK